MSPPAISLTPTVHRIPTAPFHLLNSFALVDDDGSVTLVDCGLKSAPSRIVAGLAAIGKSPADVQRIILTHAHVDHAGGARALAERSGAGVSVHEQDAGYVRRGVDPPPDTSTTLGRLIARRGGDRKSFEPVEVAKELVDGEVLPVAGGLRVIHTPGHTPGHVSLLHEPSGVLITGDAIFNVLRLRWPLTMSCSDAPLNRRTATVLGDLEYSTAAFTHGPHIADGAREKVRTFLAAAR